MAVPAPRAGRPPRLATFAALLGALLLGGLSLSGVLLWQAAARGLPPAAGQHVSDAALGAAALLAALALGLALLRAARGVAALRRLVREDPRTGLANEAAFRARLEDALSLARRQGWHVGVLAIDLRGFRAVNEAVGRAGGDAVLEALGRRLREGVRREDTVARLGADRFAVVQAAVPQPDGATQLAARLAEEIGRPLPLGPRRLRCQPDIGVAVAPADGTEAGMLLCRAESALALARSRPQPGVALFDPGRDAALRRRATLEEELRAAVAAGAFTLHWQPQRRLSDRRLTGFEALLRWPHPERGSVPPDVFVPIAEATGMIVPLGAWVLQQACREAASWPGGLTVAVNLSPAQFRAPGLREEVAGALAASGLPAHRLELEVTESALHRDLAAAGRLLEELRALGIGLAMDDFGTGWSSLAHLWRLPFGKLKIDRGFLPGLPQDRRAAAIVQSVLGLGRSLEMTVVAEGVETEAQVAWLLAQGCAQGQGWLFGRPVPAAAARRLIEEEPCGAGVAARTPAG